MTKRTIVSLLLLAMATATAEVISLSTSCPDALALASPGGGTSTCGGIYSSALASGSFSPAPTTGARDILTASTTFNPSPQYISGPATAIAVMDGDFLLTALGGTPSSPAYFSPCLITTGTGSTSDSSGWASIQFGPIAISSFEQTSNTCMGFNRNDLIPIQFGTQESFHLHMEAHSWSELSSSGTGGAAMAEFLGGYIADSTGTHIVGTSLVLVDPPTTAEIPEPASFLIVASGLVLLILLRQLQMYLIPQDPTN